MTGLRKAEFEIFTLYAYPGVASMVKCPVIWLRLSLDVLKSVLGTLSITVDLPL